MSEYISDNSDKNLLMISWGIENAGFLSSDLENVSVALSNLSICSDPVAQATVSTIATAISSYAQQAERISETVECGYRGIMKSATVES